MDAFPLLLDLARREVASGAQVAEEPLRLLPGTVDAMLDSGEVVVVTQSHGALNCDCLLSSSGPTSPIAVSDLVLVALVPGMPRAIVLGRVGKHNALPGHLKVEAAESLTLQCGGSRLDLRADGQVLIKGDDVVVHAKGTQRIRAGTVAIN